MLSRGQSDNDFSVSVAWDAEHYSDLLTPAERGTNDTRENAFKDQFPPPEVLGDGPITKTEPTTAIDIHGRIILWYLPKALTDERKVRCPINSRPAEAIAHQRN